MPGRVVALGASVHRGAVVRGAVACGVTGCSVDLLFFTGYHATGVITLCTAGVRGAVAAGYGPAAGGSSVGGLRQVVGPGRLPAAVSGSLE